MNTISQESNVTSDTLSVPNILNRHWSSTAYLIKKPSIYCMVGVSPGPSTRSFPVMRLYMSRTSSISVSK